MDSKLEMAALPIRSPVSWIECLLFCLSLTGQCPGTAVSVIGTTTGTTDLDPSWECFVDNVSIGSKPPFSFPENNRVFCEVDSLPDAQHTITLRAIISARTLWFDRILYSPSSSVNVDLSLIMVDAGDPAVTYGSGWQDMKDSKMTDRGKMTLQQGANATVDFSGEYLAFMREIGLTIVIGTSLKWFSLIPSDEPLASTSATYSVDGGTPTTFTLSGLVDSSEANATEQYNQLFFEASGLSPGQHRIEVVHGGNNETTPLSLAYVVIQNAPVPAPASSTSSPGSSSTPTPNSSGADGSNLPSAKHKGVSTGSIAGGAVGGVIALVAVTLFLMLLRRRRKRNGLDHDFNWRRLRT
jgi:hypothetical protein